MPINLQIVICESEGTCPVSDRTILAAAFCFSGAGCDGYGDVGADREGFCYVEAETAADGYGDGG